MSAPTAVERSITINAPVDRVRALLVDRIEHPEKHVPSVTHSEVIETTAGAWVRRVFDASLSEGSRTERIVERAVDGGWGYTTVAEQAPVSGETFGGPTDRVIVHPLAEGVRVSIEVVVSAGPAAVQAAGESAAAALERLREEAENPIEVPGPLAAYYRAVDAMDVSALAPLLTEDTRLRLGNGPEIVGRSAVLDATRGVPRMFRSIRHDVVRVYDDGTRWFVDAWVEYTTHEDRVFFIPNLTRAEHRDGLISAVITYGDSSPIRHGW